MNRQDYEEIKQRWLNAYAVIVSRPFCTIESLTPTFYMWKVDEGVIRIVSCYGRLRRDDDLPTDFHDFYVTTKGTYDAVKLAFDTRYCFPELFPRDKVPDLMKLFKERIPDF